MGNNGYNLPIRIAKLADKIVENCSGKPIVFVDTGAIIDFEREVERVRIKDKSANTTDFYNRLFHSVNGPFLVTSRAMYEVANHRLNHTLREKPEISEETFNIVNKMHQNYSEFFMDLVSHSKSFDEIGYSVYWAGKLAFDPSHKKCCLDPISTTDREQLTASFLARYSCGAKDGKFVYFSPRILSPDCHFTRTLETLRTLCNYDGVRAVSSR